MAQELSEIEIPALELGWLAGIIDGEGCVNVHRSKRRGGGYYHRVYLLVVNTDPRITRKCKQIADAICGTTNSYIYSKTVNSEHAEIFRWECSGRTAATVLSVLLPLLVSKREQADLALCFCDRVIGPGQVRLAGGRIVNELTPEEIEQRDNIYAQMKVLNQRGPARGRRMQAAAECELKEI